MANGDDAPRSPRLSIAHLMSVTAGVGAALAISRGIVRLRWPADRWFYGASVPAADAFDLAVAAMYGLCVATFLCALRVGRIWDSPGKILALLFATMCVCDWSLAGAASAIVSSRVADWPGTVTEPGAGAPDHTTGMQAGYVLGIWYRAIAAAVGYPAAIPLLVLVLYKTRHQAFAWRCVWAGFLLFDLALVVDVWAGASQSLNSALRPHYFDLAISVPMSVMVLALLESAWRRRGLDWWTALIAIPLAIFWLATLASKLFVGI